MKLYVRLFGAPEDSRGSKLLKHFGPAFFLLVAAAGYGLISRAVPLVDESCHMRQIMLFVHHQWKQDAQLAMLPGYHALIALLAVGSRRISLNGARFFTLLLSLVTVRIFCLCTRALHDPIAPTRTLQFAFFPLLFPFFFLVYTDVTALGLVLAMVLLTLQGRHRLAGLAGLLSCLVRQTNVVWVALLMLLSYVDTYGWTFAGGREAIRRYWVHLLTGALFVVFVVVNGGVAVGDPEAHPLGLYLTNVFFLLFLSFFLFLPLYAAHWREALRLLTRWPTWGVLAGLFMVFWFRFVIDHPYNTISPHYFMRNFLLGFFSATGGGKLLFFLPVALSVLCLWVIPLRRHWWLLSLFTVLCLLPEWLVEQRYYLVSLSLFGLAREPETQAVEDAQLAVSFGLALFFFVVSARHWLFL